MARYNFNGGSNGVWFGLSGRRGLTRSANVGLMSQCGVSGYKVSGCGVCI